MKYKLMMIASSMLIAIMQVGFGAAAYSPPMSGKFFYAQLNSDGQFRSYVTFGVGKETSKPISLMLNSEELTAALFTTDCTTQNTTLGALCTVPDPYKPVNISTDDQRVDKNISYEIAYLYQNDETLHYYGGGISRISLTGWETKTMFNITLPSFLRQFVYNGYVFEIIQLSAPYKSDLVSGFIGLGPYTAIDGQDPATSRVSYGENFMYQLKHEGHIDSQVVAFYLSTEQGQESMVKFGSYDPEGFKDSNMMTVLNTVNKNSWAVGISYIQIDSMKMSENLQSWNTIVEPAYPFIYVPKMLYNQLNNTFRGVEPFELTEHTQLGNLLKGSCDHVKQLLVQKEQELPGGRFGFGFKYYDGFEVWFNFDELLLDASYIFPHKNMNEACFIGIFPNTNAKDTNSVYLGQSYLKKYYTFFDASGYQSNKHSSLVVGTGLKNPNAFILKSHYNSSTWNYDKNDGDQSQWTYTPNPFTNKITATTDDDEAQSGKTILYLVIIAAVLVVVITVVICALERSRKRTERATFGNMSSRGKTNDDEGLSVPFNSNGSKQDINASFEPGQTLGNGK